MSSSHSHHADRDPHEITAVEAHRALTETRLAESGSAAELLDLVLAATNDGIMDWNTVTGVVAYSGRWKALLGYEEHELLDSPSLWRELSHPDTPGACATSTVIGAGRSADRSLCRTTRASPCAA
jgi:PAS domain-containing protein